MKKRIGILTSLILFMGLTSGCNGLSNPTRGGSGNVVSISNIAKTKTEGNVDTYTITYTDGSTDTFTVTNGVDGINGINGVDGNDGHSPVVTIGTNGNWFIDNVDSGISAKGEKGDKGDKGDTGATGNGIISIAVKSTNDEQTVYTITFSNGETFDFTVKNGEDGANGIVPRIGNDGYWYVGDTNTQVRAIGVDGKDGDTPYIGQNGNWWIGETDTNIKAAGAKGDKGEAGASFLQGSGAPSSSLGNNGDTYVDLLTNNIYYKESGNWSLVGNINPKESASYTVKFYCDDQLVHEEVVAANSKVPEYKVSKEGYTITPYHVRGYDSRPWVFTGYYADRVTEDVDLVCESIPNTYTVTLNPNGGTLTQTSYEFTYDSNYSIPTPQSIDVFQGWKDEDGESVASSGIWKIASDITLTASWSQFFANGLHFTLNENNDLLVAGFEKTPLTDIVIPEKVEGHDVVGIRANAFKGCQILSISFPNSLETIGDSAFENCYSLHTLDLSNTKIRSIGDKAFANFLPDIICLPSTITYVGSNAFLKDKRTNILFASSYEGDGWDENWDTDAKNIIWGYKGFIEKDSVRYVIKNDDTLAAIDLIEQKVLIVIPQTINDMTVNEILAYAFSEKSLIQTMNLPDTITRINDGGFCHCSNLTQLNMPSSLKYIGDSAFINTDLVTLDFPSSLSFIGEQGFDSCDRLESVHFNGEIEAIKPNTFEYCSALKNINLEMCTKRIEHSAFYGAAIENVRLSNTLEEIGDYAFKDCTHLKYIYIPTSVTKLGCVALKTGIKTHIFFGADSAQAGWNSQALGGILEAYIHYSAVASETALFLEVSNINREFTQNSKFIKETAKLVFADGSTSEVEATFTGYLMGVIGTQTIVVSYTYKTINYTTSYTIQVSSVE